MAAIPNPIPSPTQAPDALPVASRTATPRLDFGALLEEFLGRLDRSPETERSYRSTLRTFGAWAAQQPAMEPELLVMTYKQQRMETHAPGTVSHDLAVLRRFFGHLVRTGRLAKNPADHIRPPRQPRGYKRDALTLTEAVRLLDSVDTSTDRGKRDLAILNLMVRAGLRDVELHRADVGHLATQDGHQVLWVHGKGRDEADEFVVLNRRARAALEDYLATRGELEQEAPLFVGVDGRSRGRLSTRQLRAVVTARLEAIGLKSKRVTAHSLRHTAATLAIQAGASLSAVQHMMRHADPRTTSRYVHLHDRVSNAAEKTLEF